MYWRVVCDQSLEQNYGTIVVLAADAPEAGKPYPGPRGASHTQSRIATALNRVHAIQQLFRSDCGTGTGSDIVKIGDRFGRKCKRLYQ